MIMYNELVIIYQQWPFFFNAELNLLDLDVKKVALQPKKKKYKVEWKGEDKII